MRAAYAVQMALLILGIIYAWLRGGSPERAVATVIPSIAVLDLAYHTLWGNVTIYDRINAGHLVIDLLALIAMVAIALRANRLWTIWAASAQTIAVLAHFLRVIAPGMHPWVYAAMDRGPSWLEIALLFIGTAIFQYRQRGKSARLPIS